MADQIVKISYGETILASLTSGQQARLCCSDRRMTADVIIEADFADSPLPLEIGTEAEMTALLTIGEIGAVYKYTGETGIYENGSLYILEAAE